MAEFTVSTGTHAAALIDIAVLEGGSYVIAWTQESTGKSSIYCQKYNQDGSPSSLVTRVHHEVTGLQGPAVVTALKGGSFIISWYIRENEIKGSSGSLYARLYDDDLSPLTDAYQLGKISLAKNSSTHKQHIAALEDGGFVIAQVGPQDNMGYLQRYCASGEKMGESILLQEGRIKTPKIISLKDNKILVIWNQKATSKPGLVIAKLYDVSDNTIKEEQQLSLSDELRTSHKLTAIASSNGGFLLVWADKPANNHIYTKLYDAAYRAAGSALQIDLASNNFICSALDNGSYMFVSSKANGNNSSLQILTTIYNTNGTLTNNEPQLGTYIDGKQVHPQIMELTKGGFAIIWLEESQSSPKLHIKTYETSSLSEFSPADPLTCYHISFTINLGEARDIDFAPYVQDKGSNAGTLKIRIDSLPSSGTLYDIENNRAVAGSTYGLSQLKYKVNAGATDDHFSYSAVDPQGVQSSSCKFQLTINKEFRVNVEDNHSSFSGIAALSDNSFIIMWTQKPAPSSLTSMDSRIYLRQYDAYGNSLKGPTQASTLPGAIGLPEFLTALKTGGFLVAWEIKNHRGPKSGLYGTLYDNNMNDIFWLNLSLADQDQVISYRGIAALEDGGFIITWHKNPDYTGYAQKYDASGNRVGSEMEIGTAQFGGLKVTSIKEGNLVFIWSDNDRMQYSHVYSKVYSTSGTLIKDTFKVNPGFTAAGGSDKVIALTNGGFLAVWVLHDLQMTHGICTRPYDASGSTLAAIKCITAKVTFEGFAALALRDGGYMFAWNTFEPNGIYVYLHQKNDSLIDSSFKASTAFGVHGYAAPQAAMLPNGDFVITWTVFGDKNIDVYAKLYDEIGNAWSPGPRLNAVPTCKAYSLSLRSNQTDLSFKGQVSDLEDALGQLKIKIKALPKFGKLMCKTSREYVVQDEYYDTNELQYYVTNNYTTSDSFIYTVLDTRNFESKQCLFSITKCALNNNIPFESSATPLAVSKRDTANFESTNEASSNPLQYQVARCKNVQDGFTYTIVNNQNHKISLLQDNEAESNTMPIAKTAMFYALSNSALNLNLNRYIEGIDLKIKIENMPSCGKIYDKSKVPVSLERLYQVDELVYDMTGCHTGEYHIGYRAVDTRQDVSSSPAMLNVIVDDAQGSSNGGHLLELGLWPALIINMGNNW